MDVEEMVALFLHVLGHDVKNRQIQREFVRLSEIVSQHFNMVLMVVLRLHDENYVPYLLQNCIGALDGTYIKVNVSAVDRPRYRTRKGEVATNFLGVCDTKGDFVFIFVSWEGSAANSRILRDALSRPNSLKVLKGEIYFWTLTGGQRYHLQEWRGAENALETLKEFFNMKHSSARNVIEGAFGLLKGRWAILHEKSYYPVEVQCPTIMACCLLHNLINREMTYIDELDDEDDGDSTHATTSGDDITYIEPSNKWTEWRCACFLDVHGMEVA
ncbi:putative nuclease HARBI1 [Cucumis melo var. makuwa]|uniref:Putative nuclease HARBI1 n=1 Tax=Cucumis melo var. makuwa TaxID=1194695 RepID=A0A5D3D8H4_CUCMM|nr:putative nuclease HARBI1 [Cucumis melo var. makuwa]